jgi:uncharacterized protein YaaN involved in tellurite resistance
MLKQQSTEVGEQAASSTVAVEKLQKSFANIYATMDEIDTFKVKALSNLEQTIDALEVEIDKSRAYVNRARAQEGAEGAD